ncbi:uncharacterized protein [Rutidosis leptorrhynchoides]|uniref:uncharacterized protein n=1 Tax=Rutidosis leptorrhynchoides TaxID=125765 RepID=UPI003A993E8E
MKNTWERTELERAIIVVNEFGQPVNKKSCELTHFIGVLARSGKQCPLYKRWQKVNKSRKKDLLDIIKTKFDIRGDADKWILQSISKKDMSDKNKRNWQKRSLYPLIGKKSYAQIREELKIQLGREPSRVDIFERSFEKADITNNSEAVKQLEQMKELFKELPEGSLNEPGPDDIYA